MQSAKWIDNLLCYAIRVLVQVQHLLLAKEDEEEAKTDEEVFLSTAFNNKLLFEHTLCRPVCRLSIVYRKTVLKMVEQKKKTKTNLKYLKENCVQVHSKISLQWPSVMSNLKSVVHVGKYIWIYFMESFII